MKRKLSKFLASVLAVTMLLSSVVVSATGTEPGVSSNRSLGTAVDPSTLTSWGSVFGGGTLSTKDIGRIWNDKTVSDQDITLSGDIGNNVTISKEQGADFLVALSALGSAADITDTTQVPTDTVFVLDLSNNMWEDIDSMVSAVNDALRTLMNANPQNRVAVVAYSTQSATLLPLEHYSENSDFLTVDGNTVRATATRSDGSVQNASFNRLTTNSHKYTQSGVYTGMQLLRTEPETTAVVGTTTVTRAPVMILVAEGEAKYGSENFVNPPASATIGEVGQRDSSRYAQSFAAAMTAAYMKEEVTRHYYGQSGETARVYTIGVDTENCDAPALAYAYLDPSQTVPEHFTETGGDKTDPTASWALNYFKEKFNDYNTYGTAAIHTGSLAGGNLGWQETDITKAGNNNVTVNTFEYNDQYYDITDANWSEIFEQIADDVSNQAPTAPTDVEEGAAGTGGESGKLIFTDQLGTYMKVTGMPTVVFAGTVYHAVRSEVKGNTTSYFFEGEVSGNEIYGTANLADIVLTVTQQGDRQTLKWEIPANLLPLRSMTVDGKTDENGNTSYTISESNKAYPIRLFYSVAKDDTVQLGEEDNDYLAGYSKDGETSYYAGLWESGKTAYGETTSVFTPAKTNAFYYYTEDTPVYVLYNNTRGYLTEADAQGVVDLIPPGTGSGLILVDGVQYSLERATEYVEGRAYYYAHTYYEATGNGAAADLLIDYHRVMQGANLQGHTTQDAGGLLIQQGTNKLSRVSDVAEDKSQNLTGTVSTYRVPEYKLDGNGKVTIYLGNNGLLTEATPTGDLTVTVNPTTGDGSNEQEVVDKEFTYTLELYNSQANGYAGLAGSYSIKIYTQNGGGWQEEIGSATSISNGGQFKLKAGQKAVVSGLPAGSVFRVVQTAETGFTPQYTSLDTQVSNAGGIRYRQSGGTDPRGEITIQNLYAVGSLSFSLNYYGNPLEGGNVSNLPTTGGNLAGGTISLDNTVPTHSNVKGNKVLFLGWSESRTTKIFGAQDKDEYNQIASSIYQPGANFALTHDTGLYAVWGYDANGDNNPDVQENTFKLTYHANGGTFGAGETREVPGLLKQTGYPLDFTQKPTHGDVQGTKIAFVGWSETQTTHIYTFNDSEPLNTVQTVDISKDTTVYAVWGYDTDGDGTADIQENSYVITAKAETNGSISPSGDTPVLQGQDQSFAIQPNSGFAVDTIKIETLDDMEGTVEKTDIYRNQAGASLPQGCSWNTWNFYNVTTDYRITVTFAESQDGKIPDKYNRTLTYDANGGQGAPAQETGLIDNQTHRLSTQKPSHAAVEYQGKQNVAVVFLGWLASDNNEYIYEKEDAKPTVITSVRPNGADVTVYAAWGYDSDGDGTADINEVYYDVAAQVKDNTGGTVTPEQVSVKAGDDQAFTIQAASNYALDTISVDGAVVYTNNDASALFQGSWTLQNVQAAHQLVITFAEDLDGDGLPDKYKEIELTGIENPAPITGVANGTPLDDIALPAQVTIHTTAGERQATVSWDKAGVTGYDPSKAEAQTFTVSGTVTLPGDVKNSGNLPLEASISVTVEAKGAVTLTSLEILTTPQKLSYLEGETLDLTGLSVKLTYSDTSTETVEWKDLAAKGITASPADGATLSVGPQTVTVSKGGFSDTFTVSVEKMEQVAAPGFQPAGGTYQGTQNVVITTATPGATIYYTTDGTTPDVNSKEYTGPIAVAQSTTIRAVAVKSGMKDSAVSTAEYVIQTAPPVVKDYTITAEAGEGGSITPEGKVSVAAGADQNFVITAAEGFVIDKLLVNGAQMADASGKITCDYSFFDVAANQTISVTFRKDGGTAEVPSNPSESESSSKPGGNGGGSSSTGDGELPMTGGESTLNLWLIMLLVSLASMTATVIYSSRKKNSRSR